MHPRFELPPASDPNKDSTKRPPVCHNCGELGHKASFCPKLPPDQREAERQNNIMKHPYNHHAQQKLQSQLREQREASKDQEHPEDPKLPPNNHNHPHAPPQTHPPPHFQFHHQNHQNHQNHHQPRPPFQPRKLEDITCFKCGTKGHYANRCYSFLNNSFPNK